MQVSVIIPMLNEAANIAQAVRSAAGAEEIICVDGGSRDRSAELASDLDAIVVNSKRGRARQLNHGAAHATGDLLLFLHADNWLGDDCLPQLRAAYQQRQIELGGFEQQIEARSHIYRWIERGNAWRARRRGLLYGDQAIWIRRGLFEQLGGFATIPLMEEVEFMRRARQFATPNLLPGPVHVSPRRWQTHGVVRQTARNWMLLIAYRCGVTPERLAAHYRTHSS